MRKLLTTTASLLLLGISASSQAAVISFSDSASGPTELVGSLNLGYFDGSLGTLTGVTLNLSQDFTSAGTVQSTAMTPQFATVDASLDVIFTGGLPTNAFSALSASDTTGLQIYQPGSIGDVSFAGTASQTNMFTNFGDFTSAGTFAIDYQTLTGLNVVGGGGNLEVILNTDANVFAEVTYTFDEAVVVDPDPVNVPEPATMSLLGLGLLGMTYSRRRRKS